MIRRLYDKKSMIVSHDGSIMLEMRHILNKSNDSLGTIDLNGIG